MRNDRAAYCVTQKTLTLHCDAFVLLPDRLHAVWTLPNDDYNPCARDACRVIGGFGDVCAERWVAIRRVGFSPPFHHMGKRQADIVAGGLKPTLRQRLK